MPVRGSIGPLSSWEEWGVRRVCRGVAPADLIHVGGVGGFCGVLIRGGGWGVSLVVGTLFMFALSRGLSFQGFMNIAVI